MSTKQAGGPGLILVIQEGAEGHRRSRKVSLALSPSRAGDFMRCPLLFRFRAIDRLPERPASAAVRGTLVHAVLDRLFELPAAKRTLSAATALIHPAWRALLAADPSLACAVDASLPFPLQRSARMAAGLSLLDPAVAEAWIEQARPLVETYFRLEDPTRLQPSARELRLSVQVPGGPPLRGIIDRLDISPDGWLRVVDYKTGKSPNAGFEQSAMFQMHFYALLIWRARGTVPKRLQLLYLGDGESMACEPTEQHLEMFERKLRALWDAVESALDSGVWPATPSRMCDWCDHQSRCPAQGGVEPPVPTLLEAGPAGGDS